MATKNSPAITEISEIDLAWAAGLFEGEGCISVDRAGSYRSLRLSMKMTDQDVMQRFYDIVQFGSLRQHNPPSIRDNGYKPQYIWVGVSHKAEELMWLLCKHLGQRRRSRFLEIMQEVKKVD